MRGGAPAHRWPAAISGGRTVRMIFDIHTLMVDEAFMSGNWHAAAYATNRAHNRGYQPPRSHRRHLGNGRGR